MRTMYVYKIKSFENKLMIDKRQKKKHIFLSVRFMRVYYKIVCECFLEKRKKKRRYFIINNRRVNQYNKNVLKFYINTIR